MKVKALKRPRKVTFKVFILQDCFQQELSNTIDEINSIQNSFRFSLHPDIIEINEGLHRLPNGALDLKKVTKYLVERNSVVRKNLPRNIVFISSRPFSDMNLVKEFQGKSLEKELNQCLFYDSFQFKHSWQALVSTFIWERLPIKKDVVLPCSPSGRRALQPYLLFMLGTLALDQLVYMPFHEETRGCPFDYCNKVSDIDESFRVKEICEEHEEYLKKQVAKKKISKDQYFSIMAFFNRAFDRPARYKFDVAISYAGSERSLAKRFRDAAKKAGLKVFFDRDYSAEMWGKRLIEYLISKYRDESRYCLMLISRQYARSIWTDCERHSALERTIQERGSEYILPICLDNTKLKEMPSDLRYFDLQNRSERRIKEIERALIKKLDP